MGSKKLKLLHSGGCWSRLQSRCCLLLQALQLFWTITVSSVNTRTVLDHTVVPETHECQHSVCTTENCVLVWNDKGKKATTKKRLTILIWTFRRAFKRNSMEAKVSQNAVSFTNKTETEEKIWQSQTHNRNRRWYLVFLRIFVPHRVGEY